MSFYKILVIGDVGVGKTSLVNRIVYNTFTEKYKATIGCEFGLKVIDINGENIRIQLWDLAGQDRLGGISRLYCRDANGALVITDITRRETLEKATSWKANIDENSRLVDGTHIPMILCANKYDLSNPHSCMTQEELNEFAGSRNFLAGIFTSAKTGANTEKALMMLVTEMMNKCPIKEGGVESKIVNATKKLEAKPAVKTKKGCC